MNINPFSVENKVVIITGGTGFLGRHYAEAFCNAGARVVLLDHNAGEAIRWAPDAFRKIPIILGVDITDEDAVKDAFQSVINLEGTIDILINNAAMNPAVGSDESAKMFVPYEEYPIELFRKEIDVNLTGTMICMKAVAGVMKQQKRGVIINVSSEVSNIAHDHRVYNKEGKFKSPAYVASKTAIVGLTRQWAAYLGPHNVRVIAFSPGGVENAAMPRDFVERFGATNMLNRMARPEEHADVMLFLCSDASSFMTGVNITNDGGKSAW